MTSRPAFDKNHFKYKVEYNTKFKKDYTRCKKQGNILILTLLHLGSHSDFFEE